MLVAIPYSYVADRYGRRLLFFLSEVGLILGMGWILLVCMLFCRDRLVRLANPSHALLGIECRWRLSGFLPSPASSGTQRHLRYVIDHCRRFFFGRNKVRCVHNLLILKQ